MKGVFSLEFIDLCHIDTDIRFISTKSGPDFSSTLTEGDGGTPIFSQQETVPAKRAACNLIWESRSVEGLTAFPKRTFHSRKVIPWGGDETVIEGFGGTWPTW